MILQSAAVQSRITSCKDIPCVVPHTAVQFPAAVTAAGHRCRAYQTGYNVLSVAGTAARPSSPHLSACKQSPADVAAEISEALVAMTCFNETLQCCKYHSATKETDTTTLVALLTLCCAAYSSTGSISCGSFQPASSPWQTALSTGPAHTGSSLHQGQHAHQQKVFVLQKQHVVELFYTSWLVHATMHITYTCTHA